MKQWVLIGAPKAATALLYLIKEERKEDRDLEFTKYVVMKALLVFLVSPGAIHFSPYPQVS